MVMNRTRQITHEKLEQAVALLPEHDLDCWLLLGRETGELCDPSLPLLFDGTVTWHSAFLLHAGGERIAIVGRYDAIAVESAGGFTKVIGYDEDISKSLLEELHRLQPGRIGLNFSRANHSADGLTMGMYLNLLDWLQRTPFHDRLVSAEQLASALRARKSAGELQRIQNTIARTVQMLDQVPELLWTARTELELQQQMHQVVDQAGVETAWTRAGCPTVNFGPDSPVGHVMPSDLAVQPGHVVHLDFGIRMDAYCSDLQRCWYVARPGEREVPADVQRGFDAVVGAIQAAAAYLRPGRVGADVDRVARDYLVAAGYPEYKHALGHQVGRSCHDGGTLLGPRWPRYGDTVERTVAESEVYTLELGVMTSAGGVSLEEMVVITADGCRFLTEPQTLLPILSL